MNLLPSRRLRAAFALAFVTLIALPGVALGHAELDTVTPADTSTVAGTPPEIKMTFTEALNAAKSSIVLVDAGGNVIEGSSSVPAGSNVKTMTFLPNGDLGPGAYTLRWASASAADGDIARGTTTFTVTPSASPIEAPSDSPSATASEPASPSSSAAPSAAPSAGPSEVLSAAPSPSSPPTVPASSTSEALIPIVAVVIVLGGLGLWLLRGRSRAGR